MQELKYIIAKNISELRKREALTQLELAEKLNYSDKAVSKWERGEAMPDIGVLKEIADLFSVSLDYLVEEEHKKIPEAKSSLKLKIHNRGIITAICILAVWLVATFVFITTDIIIENITGFTEDDTVALTGIPSNSAKRFYVDGLSPDIRNVIIKSINSATHYANVRLLNQGGIKLYNILIDGIMDSSKDMPGTKRGGSGVRIGDHHMYGERHATSDETYNITVRNVYSRAISPLNVVCNIGNFQTDNIQCFDRE